VVHIGRDYKLWFRRDFGLNHFNNRAFGESYKVVIGEFLSSAHAGPFFLTFRARNTNKEDPDARLWTFDNIAFSGVHWAGDMLITNDPNNGWTDMRIRINTDVTFNAYGAFFRTTESPVFEYTASEMTSNNVILQTPICHPVPPTTTIECNVWEWSDGP
jgi:hypothetical protein